MLIKIQSSLSHMANRSASGFREKLDAYEIARSRGNFSYGGVPIGNSGRLLRERPGLPPLLLYHIKAGLSIGNLNKKERIFHPLLSKNSPSSQQLQQATSSRVSIMKWIHSSQLHFVIVITFVIVFARGRPGVIVMATGVRFPRFLPVVSAVAISTSCHFLPLLSVSRSSH